MKETNKEGEIPRGQEQWGVAVIPVPKGVRAGIRCHNINREFYDKAAQQEL